MPVRELCFAKIKTTFEMNNIQRWDVTLFYVLWLAKLPFARHTLPVSVITMRINS